MTDIDSLVSIPYQEGDLETPNSCHHKKNKRKRKFEVSDDLEDISAKSVSLRMPPDSLNLDYE